MATVTQPSNRTLDTLMQMKDAGLIAESAAAEVSSVAKIVDLGAAVPASGGTVGLFHGTLQVDVSAIEIASNDELYEILVEGSDSATFASGIEELGRLALGPNEVLTGGGDVDSTVGRYHLMFTNQRHTRRYRYIRVYTVVAGTIATGINYTAWVTKTER